MSARSRQTVLGIGFAGLILQAVMQHPFFTHNSVALFKVVTPQDTIVIGFPHSELEDMHANDADTLAKAIGRAGAMNVWQYQIRRNASGELEQTPVKQIALMSAAAVRVEAYETPLKVVPITAVQMH